MLVLRRNISLLFCVVRGTIQSVSGRADGDKEIGNVEAYCQSQKVVVGRIFVGSGLVRARGDEMLK
jgi:hypothetical protein